MGVLVPEAQLASASEPTLSDLRDALLALFGTNYGVHSPTSISRFTDTARHAAAYRHGRVLLAGDAAHVHPPVGGQGLNIGVQDAVNLGWKLAQVRRISPGTLLDTYHAERHPVADATYEGTWELPVLGIVSAVEAVLIRPDGYVAWVGDGRGAGLTDALRSWFGAPAADTCATEFS